MHSPPEYTALSYTWGERNPKTDQQLSLSAEQSAYSGQLTITFSLDEALRHLRQPSKPVALWIDQICIDQTNKEEKAAQVSVMGEVYTNAQRVIVWLGPGSAESDGYIDKMAQVGALAREEGGLDAVLGGATSGEVRQQQFWDLMDRVVSFGAAHPSRDGVAAFDVDLLDRAEKVLFGDGELGTTGDMREAIGVQVREWFQSSWFTRDWVIQEYGLARRAEFRRGNKSIDTELFALAHTVLSMLCTGPRLLRILSFTGRDDNATLEWKRQNYVLQASQFDNPMDVLSGLRRRCQSRDRGYTLCELTRLFYQTNRPLMRATLNRDRIYAFLSLVPNGITPNYTPEVTTDTAYIRATRHMIESDPVDLSVLEMAQFPKTLPGEAAEAEAAGRLPSWVPDFMHFRGSISAFPALGNRAWLYTPTGDGDARLARIIGTEDERTLGLEGIVVDKVETTGAVWEGTHVSASGSTTADPDLRRLLDYLADVRSMCQASPRFQSAEGMEELPLRVMLGDMGYEANARPRRSTPQDIEELRQLLEACKIMRLLRKEDGTVEELKAMAGAAPGLEDTEEQLKGYVAVLIGRLKETMVLPAVKQLVPRLDAMSGKRSFLTRAMGCVGMGPRTTQPGDVVVLFYGARTPYVVRPCPGKKPDYFELLGEAYCDGIMYGEAVGQGSKTNIFLV